VDEAVDIDRWSAEGEREGVQFFGARRYDFHQREQPYLRLGFSYLDDIELEEAVRRMARALARAARQRPLKTARTTAPGSIEYATGPTAQT